MSPIKEPFGLSRQRLKGWIIGLSLGLSILFSVFYLESYFGASFYVLSNKNMALYSFSSSLVSSSLDPFIWGAACFVVLGCLLLTAFSSKVSNGVRAGYSILSLGLVGGVGAVLFGAFSVLGLVFVSLALLLVCCYSAGLFAFSRFGLLKCILLVAFVIEVGALILYNLPYTLNLPFASSAIAENWRIVELSLSNLAYPILPYAYLLFVLLGIAAFLVELVYSDVLPKKLMQTRLSSYYNRLRGCVESVKEPKNEPKSARFPLTLVLIISFALSIGFVAITVLPWFNPTNRLVAVDSPPYYDWLDHMRGLDAGSAIQFAVHNDRTLFLLGSYALSFAFNPVSVVQLMPALLIPIFCVVSLYLVKSLCGLRETWVYTVLLVPFSIQALALIYSGYFANMLAVIFVYLYFGLLLRFSGGVKRWRLILLLGISLLVLFSHSWTWYIFVISLAGFLALEWRNTLREPNMPQTFRSKLIVFGFTVMVGLTADFARSLIASKSASLSVFETATSGLSLPNVDFIISGLKLTTNFYLGGVFSGAVFLVLSIVGFVFLLSYRSSGSRLILSWFAVGCVPVLLASGEYVFNRFMFLMPSLVFSALGFAFLVRFGVLSAWGSNVKKVAIEFFILGLLMLFLCNFALGYLTNVNIF